MSEDRKHHPYSPSKLQFLEACPGFSGIEGAKNEASILGTKIHDAIESGVTEGLGFTDDQLDKIAACREYYLAKLAQWPGATLYVEVYAPIDAEETTAGYFDVAIVNAERTKAVIIDWKTGQNAVEPVENNLQGMAYLLGLLFEVPTLEEVTVEFVMPFQGNGGIVDSHTFYRAEFEAMYLRIKVVVARAKAARAAREAGETYPGLNPNTSTCLFCANIAGCTAVHKFALATGKKYNPLIVPDVINPSLIKNPVDAGRALEFFAVMTALAAGYRAAATEKALTEEGFMPAGYMLVTQSKRKIESQQRFYETLKGLGWTEAEIFSVAEFTLGPAEKIVSNKAERGKKKAAVEELGALLSANGATVEGAPVTMLRKKSVEAPKNILTA